jgi:hypothetical protein
MSTGQREYLLVSFPSLVDGLFFAQVHDIACTRVVHETGLYTTPAWAKHAAKEWAETSQSEKAEILQISRHE